VYANVLGYQLLDCSREQAWKHHAAGAARFIELRGAFLYKSEFEKALFIAQTGPIVRLPQLFSFIPACWSLDGFSANLLFRLQKQSSITNTVSWITLLGMQSLGPLLWKALFMIEALSL